MTDTAERTTKGALQPVLTRLEVLANFGGSLERDQLLALRDLMAWLAENDDRNRTILMLQHRLDKARKELWIEIFKMLAFVAAMAAVYWLAA